MAMLLFYVGEKRFIIECSFILRVIPKVLLKNVQSIPSISGLLILKGNAIPIVDFCQLIEQRDTNSFWHSRIIVIQDPQPGSEKIVGLLGEKVGEIVDFNPEQLSKTQFQLHSFPFLDYGYSDEKGIIQYVNLKEFFSFLSEKIFPDVGNSNE